MYHLRLKGGHYEMGVKRGKILKRCHISFPLRLDNFQLEHGRQSEEVLRNFFPEVCEEIRGGGKRYYRRGLYGFRFVDVVYGLLYV